RQTIASRVSLELAVGVVSQTALGANPERSIVRRIHRDDGVIRQRSGCLIENDELEPVKTSEPFIGTQPKLAVTCLFDGADRVLRKAALLSPDRPRVLRQILSRIERKEAAGTDGAQHQYGRESHLLPV